MSTKKKFANEKSGRSALSRAISMALGASFAIIALPAGAILLDHGPADATLGWPQWYRDSQGTAAGICKSQAASPNPIAGGGTMCFPIVPDPAGFPGNVGLEMFYNNLTKVVSTGPSFQMRYVGALEASYDPAFTVPTRGKEVVFARTRIWIDTTCTGDFTITHPLGVLNTTVTNPGRRAINTTADTLVVPGNFDAALDGPIGPLLQWDVLNPGESLTTTNAQGVVEQFLGDPNYEHTFTGSPFGTNYIEVTGPVGCDINGGGSNVVRFDTATVLGQKWTAPVATKIQVDTARYNRSAAGANSIDVQARSLSGQNIVMTGVGDMPSLKMVEERNALNAPTGVYFGHVEWTGNQPPASVNVTNLTSVPVVTATARLADIVEISLANFDVVTRQFSVRASTSDQFLNPQLAAVGIPGQVAPALLTAAACIPPAVAGESCYTTTVAPNFATPINVTVESTQGGSHLDEIKTIGNNPMNDAPNAPHAVDDDPIVAGSGATTFNVLANDVTGAVAVSQVLVISSPAKGTVVVNPAIMGDVTFTPTAGASGTDSFTYVILNASGLVSNVGNVNFTIPFVEPAPVVSNDEYAVRNGVLRVLNILANDTPAAGTTIDPASVQFGTAPTKGTVTFNANGTLNYTANAANANGAVDTFTYTVANTAGTRSTPATVKVASFSVAENVNVVRADYTRNGARWVISGATTWFSPSLTAQRTSCYLGTTVNPTQLIGSGGISTLGAWSIIPSATAPAIPANQGVASVTCQTTNGGIGQRGVKFK